MKKKKRTNAERIKNKEVTKTEREDKTANKSKIR